MSPREEKAVPRAEEGGSRGAAGQLLIEASKGRRRKKKPTPPLRCIRALSRVPAGGRLVLFSRAGARGRSCAPAERDVPRERERRRRRGERGARTLVFFSKKKKEKPIRAREEERRAKRRHLSQPPSSPARAAPPPNASRCSSRDHHCYKPPTWPPMTTIEGSMSHRLGRLLSPPATSPSVVAAACRRLTSVSTDCIDSDAMVVF